MAKMTDALIAALVRMGVEFWTVGPKDLLTIRRGLLTAYENDDGSGTFTICRRINAATAAGPEFQGQDEEVVDEPQSVVAGPFAALWLITEGELLR